MDKATDRHSSKVDAYGVAAESVAQPSQAYTNVLVNLIPPLTVGAVVLFWLLSPRSLTENPLSIMIAGFVISFALLGLERLFERHEGWRLTWKEFATDLFYVLLVYTVIGWATETFADGPLASLKGQLGITTPWIMQMPLVLQAALIIFLIEFGQYWMHRAMHDWYPLWLTHAPHHHVTQLNAMKGFVGNPIELFLISLSIVALLDVDSVALFCALSVLGVISGFAHANIRSDPPLFYSYIFTSIRHHSLHHTALSYEDTRCNYANSLILLDRIFGTYREGESSIVGQDERKRLSIWEQFMFPFQPVIEKLKKKRGAETGAAKGEP
ncbi:fatty acid hydroxylase family protein [Altererythrobacter indicus]|uniref:Fatty acid hydroxylase family protein n=1 Tax=Altericroceibacterium indicum TaxID=374177 RepID=A0A845AAH2_9SPHN|nr:sterol desaturase family protein [Altericroceibacterium indicum]MXP25805.1 fatty acid hydroxylase family protein [Altericroceibacterium indicum]